MPDVVESLIGKRNYRLKLCILWCELTIHLPPIAHTIQIYFCFCCFVAMKFRIGFLNCMNLYPVGLNARSSQTQDALDTRIAQLAATIHALFDDTPPEIVGLCEVATEDVGKQLAEAIRPHFYNTVWSGVPERENQNPETGLMLLYNPLTARVDPKANRYNANPQNTRQRAKWIVVHLTVQQLNTPLQFWLVLNHWTSAFRYGPDISESERVQSACEIGKLRLELKTTLEYRDQPMLLIGDFNCEPFERPFRGLPGNDLCAARDRSRVVRPRNRKAYFYNPTWRWLHDLEQDTASREPSLPPGTYRNDEWYVFDQLMVSEEMLVAGSFLRFLESSLARTLSVGNCSDHMAIGAVFETNE